jgi:glycosyltransferase involved in cell wall biosynthesis
MRVQFVSTLDAIGGAARATYRLYCGLRAAGTDVRMFVRSKSVVDPAIFTAEGQFGKWLPRLAYRVDALPLRLYARPDVHWSLNWLPYPIGRALSDNDADLLHLHWIGSGFIPVRSLGTVRKPVIWTLHDEWAFTGGCHYSYDCNRFQYSCGCCPQLKSRNAHDISYCTLQNKQKHWSRLNLTIVSPSRWLAEQAQQSTLFHDRRIEVIPNGIDTTIYKPMDKAFARQALNLPPDRHLILFGALSSTSDKRKGFDLLQSALYELAQRGWTNRADVVIFGASEDSGKSAMGFKTHYLGRLNDDASLALAYSTADVFVAPSIQDNLPNTVMEALACGVPCVGFRIGGFADLIAHEENGFMAEPYSSESLSQAIEYVLENDQRRHGYAEHARSSILHGFDLKRIVERYRSLYGSVLGESSSPST